RTLAAMVRLAEGLDRSHSQAVSAIDFVPRGQNYLVRLRATGDIELELWAAQRHRAPLERVLRRPLRFDVIGRDTEERSAYAEQPDDGAHVSRKTVRRGRHRRLGKNDPAGAAREMA
ncbi:MAG TPA: hypothetical protein VN085_08410, partial [Vicinamibacterales bacterium]|nr:hypothetical protein [Vicinamibacterales bacterium]